jgi:hypothetical protein
MKTLSVFILFSFSIYFLSAQNLLVNGSAEIATPATTGWTVVSMGTTGASCYNNSGWRIIQTLNGFPAAENGSYFFYPGCVTTTGGTFEIYQDVNVSINGPWIDGGGDFFTFTGYLQVYTQATPDQTEVIVEYRNSTNTTVLGSYNTGFQANQGVWTLYSNTLAAPVGTRFVRVRLLAKSVSGASVDAYFDNLSLFTSIALPVIFTSFNANASNGMVKLNWATSMEFNNDYFIIQKSPDGSLWQDVTRIKGNSSTDSEHSYSATDEKPFEGISYYRLKQVDADGNAKYSEIRAVDIAQGFLHISIFPNPAHTMVNLNTEGSIIMEADIYSSTGQLMNVPKTTRHNQITFNIAALSRGIYFIRLKKASNTIVRKISVN